jgi:hypothetical protein
MPLLSPHLQPVILRTAQLKCLQLFSIDKGTKSLQQRAQNLSRYAPQAHFMFGSGTSDCTFYSACTLWILSCGLVRPWTVLTLLSLGPFLNLMNWWTIRSDLKHSSAIAHCSFIFVCVVCLSLCLFGPPLDWLLLVGRSIFGATLATLSKGT